MSCGGQVGKDDETESRNKHPRRPTHLYARTGERLVQADQTEEERRRELELHGACGLGLLGL